MKTYQDLLEIGEVEKNRMDFVLSAIQEHKASEAYRIAKDAELGDPEYYEKALRPEVERLDALAKLVSDNMDDATIEKLWLEAVPGWFDFQYKADKIRTKYLQNRFIETGK